MEVRLFEEGTTPEWTTPRWYAGRASAPHLEEPGHRERLLETFKTVKRAIVETPLQSVCDLGAGDGGLLSLISRDSGLTDVEAWGYDLQASNVDFARNSRGVDVSLLDVVNDTAEARWGSLTVVTEMLEHLIDPHGFVRTIAENSGHIIASSPYLETVDSHYPFHTWAWDVEGYRSLIEQAGFSVLSHEQHSCAQIIWAVLL